MIEFTAHDPSDLQGMHVSGCSLSRYLLVVALHCAAVRTRIHCGSKSVCYLIAHDNIGLKYHHPADSLATVYYSSSA